MMVGMSKDKDVTLEEAMAAARRLPEDAQAELASELMERVEDVSTPDRPARRQAQIKERLQGQLGEVLRDEVMAVLRQYHAGV